MPAVIVRLRRAAPLTAILVVAFVACVVTVNTSPLARLDHFVRDIVDSHHDHGIDVAASLLAVTASGAASALWLLVALVVAWRRAGSRPAVFALCGGLIAVQGVEALLKAVIDHPGPGVSRALTFAVGGGPDTTGSFPSGHMARAVLLAMGGSLLVAARPARRAWLVAALLYTMLIAATRVYLNEHWTTDVIGGVLLGLAAVPAVAVLAERS